MASSCITEKYQTSIFVVAHLKSWIGHNLCAFIRIRLKMNKCKCFTSQLKLRVAACLTNGTISLMTAVCVVRKFALLSESWLNKPTVLPIELHPGQAFSFVLLLFTNSSIFVSRNVCVHKIGHGPCASQKWHNAIIAFMYTFSLSLSLSPLLALIVERIEE